MPLYNNGFPVSYPQFYPQNQQLYNQQVQMPQQQSQQPQQIQNGGFVSVANEEIARNYPVAPGNSVTFKCENAPYIYTKTMGFSSLDTPIFEKYKLVKEEDAVKQNRISIQEIKPTEIEELKSQTESKIEEIKSQMELKLNQLWEEVNNVKSKFAEPAEKKKDGGN